MSICHIPDSTQGGSPVSAGCERITHQIAEGRRSGRVPRPGGAGELGQVEGARQQPPRSRVLRQLVLGRWPDEQRRPLTCIRVRVRVRVSARFTEVWRLQAVASSFKTMPGCSAKAVRHGLEAKLQRHLRPGAGP